MKGLLNGMADVVFPPLCPMCNAIVHDHKNLPFCESCNSQIKTIIPPLCPACGSPFPGTDDVNHLCGDCLLSPKAFSRARAFGYYDTVLLKAIHAFKYQGETTLGRHLGRLMAGYDYLDFPAASASVVMPVPLHRRRLRERTFNQALILARSLAKRYAIPLDFTSLRRHIYTTPQISLGKAERQANVRGAFRVVKPEKVKGAKVLLVDDVYTTGNTLHECARVLIENGAADVMVLTLARAV